MMSFHPRRSCGPREERNGKVWNHDSVRYHCSFSHLVPMTRPIAWVLPSGCDLFWLDVFRMSPHRLISSWPWRSQTWKRGMNDMMGLSQDDGEALRQAKRLLEHPSLAAKITRIIGIPIEKGFAL